MPIQSIKPEQLCIGLYIELDLSWLQHSFMSKSFKIKNDKQITALKKLGLKEINYDPSRSDAEPLPLVEKPTELVAESEPELEASVEEQQRQEEERAKRLKDRRIRLNKCEKNYKEAVSNARKVMSNLRSQPDLALDVAGEVVTGIVDVMADQDATMHLVNMKGKSESLYSHSINVTMLSLMLGQKLGLNEWQLKILGVGALMHDLGHSEIPDKVLLKTTPLNKAEEDLYKMHTQYGEKIANRTGTVPSDAIKIIAQHHEFLDGSGYPKGLKGEQISKLAQIVSLVNRYDNLCNRVNTSRSSSPYEAVAILYAREKEKFDEEMLSLFITNMGVYPPGSVVKLSDDRIAAVISINTEDLLNPNVMVYDPEVPMTEAMIINLNEDGINIVETMRLTDVPKEVRDYLSLGDSVNIFFDMKPNKPES
jgi:putative nucleotidyltransferase with HDIG domain